MAGRGAVSGDTAPGRWLSVLILCVCVLAALLPATLDEHVATFLMDTFGRLNAHTTLSA